MYPSSSSGYGGSSSGIGIGGGGGGRGFWEKFRLLDFYGKTDESLVPIQKSTAGGVFTVLTVLLLLYLVFSEVGSYASIKTEDVLTVDTRRGERLPIYMDIVFHKLLCKEVAVDVVDGTTGETVEEATHQIVRQRLTKKGEALEEIEQTDLGKTENRVPDCHSCTAGLPPQLQAVAVKAPACCNTCGRLRAFYRTINVNQKYADNSAVCRVSAPYTDSEGCRVYGHIVVPRARGDFHIAAGKGFGQEHDSHSHHMHAIDWSRLDYFNISHTVNQLSFGPPIPGIKNPLDGRTYHSKELAQHTYYIQVVPTIYRNGAENITTNQFSYTQHHHTVDRSQQNFALPGLYFRYDISPLMIQITEKNRPFADFVTSMCAIVGGIYVVFGIFYYMTSSVVTKGKKTK